MIHGSVAQTLSNKASRSGHNLSDRYIQLERSLRHKDVSSQEPKETGSSSMLSTSPLKLGAKKHVEMFRGFEVPEEPITPSDSGACIF